MNLEDIKKHNEHVISMAGPRYMPGLDKDAPNIKIPDLIKCLDALSFSEEFKEYIHTLDVYLCEQMKEYSNIISKTFSGKDASPDNLSKLFKSLEKSRPLDAQSIIKDIATNIKEIEETVITEMQILHTKINKIKEEEAKNKKPITDDVSDEEKEFDIFDNFRYYMDEIYRFPEKNIVKLVSNNCLLVTGKAGTGKTHSLCDYAKELCSSEHYCILFMAYTAPIGENPLNALVKSSGLANDFSQLLDALEKSGESNGRRALLIIDGINEGDQQEWRKVVSELYKKMKKLKHVGIVVSCRSPFEKIIFDKTTIKSYVTMQHYGFIDKEFDAQKEFFNHYNIKPDVPLLGEEFSNPLTLQLICKSLQKLSASNKKKSFRGIASGQKGMTFILEDYIKSVGSEVGEEYDLPGVFFWNLLKGFSFVGGQYDGVAVRMAQQLQESLTREETLEIIRNCPQWDNKNSSDELLKKMVHSGILMEYPSYKPGGTEIYIRLPYQKFSDHLIARHLLDEYLDTSCAITVKNSFRKNKPLGKIFESGDWVGEYNMPNWAEALMIEFPERIKRLKTKNKELYYYLPKHKKNISSMSVPFMSSLIWRSHNSFSKGTDEIVSLLLGQEDGIKNKMLDILVSLSVKEKHPYDSSRLHNYLCKFKMAERDSIWTLFVNISANENTSSISRLTNWLEFIQSSSSVKVPYGFCLTSIWLLSTTDKRFRNRVTRLLTNIFRKQPELMPRLLCDFKNVDDLYVQERLLASIYAACCVLDGDYVRITAQKVYDIIFSCRKPPYHLLLRDYAQGIIERAEYLGILPQNINVNKCRPPFKSPWPLKKYSNSTIDKLGKKLGDESLTIAHSCTTENGRDSRDYGDFGRYELELMVKKFSTNELSMPPPLRQDYEDKFDGEMIGNWVAHRAYKSGWSSELFGSDSGYNISRHENRIERIGKKYQWIAMYELLGILSDHVWVFGRNEQGKKYKSAIDLRFSRDIDSTNILGLEFNNCLENKNQQANIQMSEIEGENPNERDNWVQQNNFLTDESFFEYTDKDNTRWYRMSFFELNHKELRGRNSAHQSEQVFISTFCMRTTDVNKFMHYEISNQGHKSVISSSDIESDDDQKLLYELHWRNQKGNIEWGHDEPVDSFSPTYSYSESRITDESVEKNTLVDALSPFILKKLNLSIDANNPTIYRDKGGEIKFFQFWKDAKPWSKGPMCFIDANLFDKFLAENDLACVWIMLGERQHVDHENDHRKLRIFHALGWHNNGQFQTKEWIEDIN